MQLEITPAVDIMLTWLSVLGTIRYDEIEIPIN